jgi:DNA-binding LacI/PurR family transcriptional regulator
MTAPPAKVLAGIQDASNESGYRLEIVSMSAPNLVALAERDDVAGLVLSMDRDGTPMRFISKPRICIGHWSNPDDGVISYIGDAEQATTDAVRHLCGLGHTRIAFLAAGAALPLTEANTAQFTAGLRRGFQIYGLGWDDQLNYVDPHADEDAGIDRFVRTFRDRQITAAFVPIWSTVLRLVRRLRQENLSVPKDLSIVCYGEDDLTSYIQPPMTSFDLFIRDIARQAAMTLVEHDRDGKPLPKMRFVTFPVELLVRKSTAMR